MSDPTAMTPDEMELAERCHTDSCDHLADALGEAQRLREALDRLAWCAVRYGLGRRTYVTADIAETVARVRDSLRDDTRRIIVTDIDRAEGRGPDGLGDAVDAGVWRGLRAALGDRP